MSLRSETFDRSIARVRLRQPEDMTPAERAAFEAKPSRRNNISRLFAVAETLTPHLTALNEAMATTITVPALERELVCLATLHLDRGAYEIAQHIEVARMMGIPDEKVAAIADERYGDPVFSDRERALLAFTRQVVKTVRVDDFVFDAVGAFYNSRQILELVYVISNYMMILRLTEVVELELDGTSGAGFWTERAA